MGSKLAEAYVEIRLNQEKILSELEHLHGDFNHKILSMATIGEFLGETLHQVFDKAIEKLREFVSLGMQAEDRQARLSGLLEATGEAAGYSAEEITKMAEEMASRSTQSKSEILEAYTALAKFGDIRGSNFVDAMEAARGYAAATKQDLQTSAQSIGMMLESMRSGSAMLAERTLRRAGKPLSATEKEELEKTLASGDLAKAQEMVLAKFEKYGVVADKMANTVSGKIKRIQNSFEELGEKIGTTMLPMFTFVTEVVQQIVGNLVAIMDNPKAAWDLMWAKMQVAALNGADMILEGMRQLFAGIESIFKTGFGILSQLVEMSLKGYAQMFRDLPGSVKGAIKGMFGVDATEIARGIEEVASKMSTLRIQTKNAAPIIPEALNKLIDTAFGKDAVKKLEEATKVWHQVKELAIAAFKGEKPERKEAKVDMESTRKREFTGLEEFSKFLATAQAPGGADPALNEAKEANKGGNRREKLLERIAQRLEKQRPKAGGFAVYADALGGAAGPQDM